LVLPFSSRRPILFSLNPSKYHVKNNTDDRYDKNTITTTTPNPPSLPFSTNYCTEHPTLKTTSLGYHSRTFWDTENQQYHPPTPNATKHICNPLIQSQNLV
ncbi:unnamed protein product, partial [Ectocarpus fasciculatus]